MVFPSLFVISINLCLCIVGQQFQQTCKFVRIQNYSDELRYIDYECSGGDGSCQRLDLENCIGTITGKLKFINNVHGKRRVDYGSLRSECEDCVYDEDTTIVVRDCKGGGKTSIDLCSGISNWSGSLHGPSKVPHDCHSKDVGF